MPKSIKKIDQAARDRFTQLPLAIEGREDAFNRKVLIDALCAYSCYLTDLFGLDDSSKYVYTAIKRLGITQYFRILDRLRVTLFEYGPDYIVGTEEYSLLFKDFPLPEGETMRFRALNGAFSFLLKVRIRRPDLQPEAKEKYFAAEERARTEDLTSPAVAYVLKQLNAIMRQWLRGLDLTNIRPGHSGGAVANPKARTLREKYLDMKYLSTVASLGYDPREYAPWVCFIGYQPESDYTSRLIFVPKTWKALRTVKPEPSELQYWQQGVMHALYNYVKAHPFLSTHFPFHDQTMHHKYVLEGSFSDIYSTIDLSQASDSVTIGLVRKIFANTPLLPWLEATRSEYFKYGNEKYRSYIFAGMGSSLCFPVESLVFGAICELAVRYQRSRGWWIENEPVHWSVYGDDIIVNRNIYKSVTMILELLGFTVNTEKSYHDSYFKESCGMEAYMGYNVTPARFKVQYDRGRATLLQGLISLGNTALLDRGAMTLYKWCLYKASLISGERGDLIACHEIPLEDVLTRDDSMFYSPKESPNPPNRIRWNKDLQIREVRCTRAVRITPKSLRHLSLDQVDEEIFYFNTLLHPSDEVTHEDIYAQQKRTISILRSGWSRVD